MTIPTYLLYVVLTGNALSLVAILYGVNRALAEAAWPPAERRRAFALSSAILLGWLAVAASLISLWLASRVRVQEVSPPPHHSLEAS